MTITIVGADPTRPRRPDVIPVNLPDPADPRWFAENVQRHEPLLRAWLRGRFPHLRDLDDVIQESYARLVVAREKKEVRSPKAFLFATARNVTIDQLRRKGAVNADSVGGNDELSVLEASDDVAETVARNQEIELMTEAIQSLPDRCRRVMTLRHVYGLSQKEVAGELGISVRTVEAQVTIGIKRCTEYMRRRRE